MPLTHLQGGDFTGRQMHILAFARPQTMGEDGAKEPGRRTVVQHLWRFKGFKSEIDSDGVALIGPDALFVGTQGESLFVIRGDDLGYELPCEKPSPSCRG